MVQKPFDRLFRVLDRIEDQLPKASDEERDALAEEVTRLQQWSNMFVEQWLVFEERLVELANQFLSNDESSDEEDATERSGQRDFPGTLVKTRTAHVSVHTLSDSPMGSHTSSPSSVVVPPTDYDGETSPEWLHAIENKPIELTFRKGIGFFDLLMLPEAVQEFERVVATDAECLVARLYLAIVYSLTQQNERAKQHLRVLEALETEPYLRATTWSAYGHIYAAEGRLHDATEAFRKTASIIPDYPDVHFQLGVCYYNMRCWSKAIQSFHDALAMNERDADAERYIGRVWAFLGFADEAIAHLRRAAQLSPRRYDICLDTAEVLHHFGQADAARLYYERCLDICAHASRPLAGLGWIALQSGDATTAISLFKQRLERDEHDAEAWFYLGWAHVHASDAPRATSCFERVLTLRTDDPDAQIGLARARALAGEGHAARQILVQTLRHGREPRIRKAGLLQLGRITFDEGDIAQALRYFDAALVYDRNCPETLFHKGLAHHSLGDLATAKSCFERCRHKVEAGT